MKYIKYTLNLVAVSGILLYLLSCSGMYDNVEEYSGEVIYPGKFDTVYGKIGFERVEIDLMQAGRIPASKMKLGKATRTIVEYDGVPHPIDSLCSWINITGLTTSKLYRFVIYTVDQSGNKSVPQEIALIPYTAQDRDLIAVSSPRISSSPSAAIVDWPNGLNSVVMDYCSLTYEYEDRDGRKTGGIPEGISPRFYLGNLEAGAQVPVSVTYRVVPILSDGETRLLDTINITRDIVLNMPTAETSFSPSEETVLRANGVTTFTSAAVASIRKLVFPIHISSIQDIFYFSNLEELDLTGEGLDNVMPKFTLSGDGRTYEIGGGAWLHCIKRSENKQAVSISGLQSLIDLLESGLLKKVRYIPNSLGLDDILAPYVESGVVEFVNDSFFPQEVMLPYRFWMEGRPQTSSFRLIWRYPVPESEFSFYSGTVADPATVYEIIIENRNATFAFILPKEYIWDLERYRYLKFKVIPKSIPSTFSGSYSTYLKVWPRIKTRFWGVDASNDLYGGDKEYAPKGQYIIPESAIQTRWTEFTVDLKPAVDNTQNDTGHHIRCLVINLGEEAGPNPWVKPDGNDVEYYFADFRLTK
jgi:hypothetical protein